MKCGGVPSSFRPDESGPGASRANVTNSRRVKRSAMRRGYSDTVRETSAHRKAGRETGHL